MTRVANPGDPTLSPADTARVLGLALAPIVAQGVIARRPAVVRIAGGLDTDGRGVRELQRVRERYGPGPVRVPLPGRRLALVLDPDDVERVLDETPVPFAPANREKKAALGQFQPHGTLVSHGELRAQRRRFTEAVLDTGQPMHPFAARMTEVIRAEMTEPIAVAAGTGTLDWPPFARAWWRVVRRIVLGEGARDDHALTDDLTRLRQAGNWSYLAPRQRRRRDRFRAALAAHLERAEPGSLAELVARMPAEPGVDRVDQVPQWLFAFDPAGAVTLRALGALAARPAELGRARGELDGLDLARPQELARLRAVVLESVRLWPTTPLLLRDTTTETDWRTGTLPAGTGLLIPAWYLHRDTARDPEADELRPDRWLDGAASADRALVPFSGGPGVCPGRELVLFTASTALAALLEQLDVGLPLDSPLAVGEPLPAGLDPYHLRLEASKR
ncbi:cytochrome P450 [Pseudonocardia oroxyli]|uniref:Cytochrome P450 n=1 Tax=Pseudonocardia oroxyli TaxID=366584 RepID=A0A1G7G9K8_PSEOR|nr:cytochrome P450 [Pseudonocardia oroxyli]SDE84834.1 Cytochrome P450 [Pseudonocardia oroxyli]